MTRTETLERLTTVALGLRAYTKDCRLDMHEPDEQGVEAVVSGYRLDNAMGSDPDSNHGELTVGIKRKHDVDGEYIGWFNLADLIALARLADTFK